jgi:lambda family phage portal protein
MSTETNALATLPQARRAPKLVGVGSTTTAVGLNWLDRFALAVSPSWGANRVRARVIAQTLARHYEAASVGRRTSNWHRSSGDANTANGPALHMLRALARDLVRNNSWARNGLRVIANNTVGWGIAAKPVGASPEIAEAWRRWAESQQCDSEGRLNFYGIQSLAMRTIAESGEVLIRRRPRRAEDGLAIPLQLQVLEPDFLDTSKDGIIGQSGGPIVQGVEFDKLGKRAAYWLFDQHPGSSFGASASKRVPASSILHVFFAERPGQVRGVSWLASAILNLKDFDEYEDASLMRQKIAACFAAFVTDVDGAGTTVGEANDQDPLVETLEPGLVSYLPPGRNISFANPPVAGDDGFSVRTLRRIAAGLGVTYEDMTGDFSQVNFSSARMGRLKHWSHVEDWRWNMLIPQLCDGVWGWAMEAAMVAGLASQAPAVEWTAPPKPMLEPDREGLALTRLVRAGAMTFDEMVRERGYDPDTHWSEYANGMKRLDELGIWLDSDVRRTSQAGLAQGRAGSGDSGADTDSED